MYILSEIPDGTMSMTVCTLSFPSYGFILHKLKNNIQNQKEFVEDLTKNANKLEKEDVKVW